MGSRGHSFVYSLESPRQRGSIGADGCVVAAYKRRTRSSDGKWTVGRLGGRPPRSTLGAQAAYAEHT